MAIIPKAFALTPIANDVDYISTTETLTTPWALQLDGILSFATPQHITITTTSDETAATFTVVGTDFQDQVLTEGITGPNNSVVVSLNNYKTITSITSTHNATGVTAGVNGTCESRWYVLNYRGWDFNVGIGVGISSGGGMTYAVEHTFDNVFASTFTQSGAVAYDHDTLTGKTVNAHSTYTSPPTAMRLKITAYTSGTGTMNVVQNGGA